MSSSISADPAAATRREEFVNALTHGLGIVLSVGGGAVLITLTAVQSGMREVISVSIFVTTLILLYTASTLYHAASHTRAGTRLKVFDHCAIFLLIAGTYTPFTVVGLQGAWGWSLFGVIWGMAIVGIGFKLLFTGRFRILSTAIYIAMGWLALIAFIPLVQALTTPTLAWLVAGGVFYTAGTAFYHNERIPHSHGIWHLFVLAGSVSHFVAVMVLVLQPQG